MPGNFAYTPATNIVVVTAGTALNPADFASFVVADRAGTYTIMDAIATAMNLTLDRVIRPVELRALQITFTLAGTNALAGDAINITGTDAWGNAQNESINTAVGNGAYTSAKYWRTITDIDCAGFADGAGTIDAVQPQWGVIWDYGNNQYLIEANVDFGDSLIPTYFTSKQEDVFFKDVIFQIKSSATLQLGELHGSYGLNGSCWRIVSPAGDWEVIETGEAGTFLIYDSRLHSAGFSRVEFWDGTITIISSVLSSNYYDAVSASKRFLFYSTVDAVSFDRVYVSNVAQLQLYLSPTVFNQVHTHRCLYGIMVVAPSTLTKLLISSYDITDIFTSSSYGDAYLIDPLAHIVAPRINDDGAWIKEAYSCNIHIVDKDGNDLGGVSISIEDTNGNVVSYYDSGETIAEYIDETETGIDVSDGSAFSVDEVILIAHEFMKIDSIAGNTLTVTRKYYSHGGTKPGVIGESLAIYKTGTLTTDVNGDISEHSLVFKQWIDIAKTLTEYSPYKFTISKAGYETLVMENITVDAPIAWHLELQDEVVYPAEADVRDGEGYGAGGVEFEGDLEIPIIGDVRDGIGYGADGAEFEGVLDLPSIADVKLHVIFDNGTKTGTYICPIPAGELIANLEESACLTADLEESACLIGCLEEDTGLIGEMPADPEEGGGLVGYLEEDTGLIGEMPE